MGAVARAARGSVQTERPATGCDVGRRRPRPGTHAGFMAAGSVLPGGVRGTPGSVGRAGDGCGSEGRAAGSGTPRLWRGAPRSRSTPPRAQVSSRPAQFKRANQRPPAGKGRGLRGSGRSAGSGACLLGDRGAEARAVWVSGPHAVRCNEIHPLPFSHEETESLVPYSTRSPTEGPA